MLVIRNKVSRSYSGRHSVVLMFGFFFIQLITGSIIFFARGFLLGLLQSNRHNWHLQPPGPHLITIVVVISYLISAAWSFWYLCQFTAVSFWKGSLESIGFAPAPKIAFFLSVMLSVVTTIVAGLFFHFRPPTPNQSQGLSSFRAMMTPGWPLVVSLIMIVIVAPLTEEFVFRGGGIAGLIRSSSKIRSAVIVTIIFVLIHAPQKIHYLAGFIDLTLFAAGAVWLRVYYKSLWPSIVLHVLYNIGIILDAAIILQYR